MEEKANRGGRGGGEVFFVVWGFFFFFNYRREGEGGAEWMAQSACVYNNLKKKKAGSCLGILKRGACADWRGETHVQMGDDKWEVLLGRSGRA